MDYLPNRYGMIDYKMSAFTGVVNVLRYIQRINNSVV
jgi:hypothetical protein